jgi:hypothetical protein
MRTPVWSSWSETPRANVRPRATRPRKPWPRDRWAARVAVAGYPFTTQSDLERLARRLQQGGGLVEGGTLAAKGIQQPRVRRSSKQRVVGQRVVERGAQIGLAGTHPVSARGAGITGPHQTVRRRPPRRKPRLIVAVRDARGGRLHLAKLSPPMRGQPEGQRRREFLEQRIVEEQSHASHAIRWASLRRPRPQRAPQSPLAGAGRSDPRDVEPDRCPAGRRRPGLRPGRAAPKQRRK